MKTVLLLLCCIFSFTVLSQKKKKYPPLNLTNALVIAQVDTPEDRYSLESNLTDILTRKGIKVIPTLNVLKLGSDARQLATDSLQTMMAAKGIDTYMLVSIRGYDRKYRVSDVNDDFETALGQTSFFDLYQLDIVSVSFQFKFFRDGKCVHAEVVKCGNIGARDSVLKRLRKKLNKRIDKKWK